MSNVINTSQETFIKDVFEAGIPVVVDFYATWCGPCKALSPLLDKLSVEFEGRVKIVKADIEKNEGAATDLGVRSVPTMVAYSGATHVGSKVGLLTETALREWLENISK